MTWEEQFMKVRSGFFVFLEFAPLKSVYGLRIEVASSREA